MAFGRANSLSLNTTAVNSSFAQQAQGTAPAAPGSQTSFGASTQAPASTGLFGSTMNNTTSSASPFGGQPATSNSGSSVFGGSLFNQPKPAATGLFGSTPAPAATTGGLFGSAPAPAASAGGLFGSTPAPASRGLFGAPASTPASGGLFGAAPASAPASGGLFGAAPATATSGSLFGASAKPSLFGASTTTGTGLFGSTQAAQPSGGLFGSTQQAANGSVFGGNPAAQQQNPSLLSASRYNLGQPAPFTGRLSMGQGNTTQVAATPATKLDWTNVKLVTRYSDLVDSAKEQLEAVDNLVKSQEQLSKQIEAFMPMHAANMASLQPDIDLINDKCETAESALISDAQGIQQAKTLTQKDHQDITRLERVSENQRLPPTYHFSPAGQAYHSRKDPAAAAALENEYDVNLVRNYFMPKAAEMQKLLEAYTSNLSEIENHLATIEASAVAQAQALSQQRAGGSGPDSVRQLAETLRGFESTILATAAKVGSAREGVTNLSLKTAHGY